MVSCLSDHWRVRVSADHLGLEVLASACSQQALSVAGTRHVAFVVQGCSLACSSMHCLCHASGTLHLPGSRSCARVDSNRSGVGNRSVKYS
jgi:hypothetical protein